MSNVDKTIAASKLSERVLRSVRQSFKVEAALKCVYMPTFGRPIDAPVEAVAAEAADDDPNGCKHYRRYAGCCNQVKLEYWNNNQWKVPSICLI